MIESVEVIIRQPGFPDRVVPLREGRTRLGRADDNEIVLSDVGVSRRHAQIVIEHGEVSVEDLGSGNGTYYFGHRIKAQPIRDADEVVIDPFILQFRVVGDVGQAQGPDTVAQDTLENGVRLEVVVGNGVSGHIYPILDRGLTMGRAEDRDVVVPDPASSRHHCHITREED
ncbi:MAG: FHA domain-containing protein, partial [Phycisphaerales bacterium]|nr:FHA domain-containing protein [Phycisphaerales bacterium]